MTNILPAVFARLPNYAQIMPDDPDAADLREFQRTGDRAVLSALWLRQADASWRIARWICGERADDALQDAAVQLVRDAARWRDQGTGSASRWLLTVVANAARSHRRRDRRGWLPLSAVGELPAPVAATAAVAGDDERLERVRVGLARLRPHERQSVELRYLCGLDFPAVAAALGVPERTARTRVARGLARLRELLQVSPTAGSAGVVLLLTPTALHRAPASIGALISPAQLASGVVAGDSEVGVSALGVKIAVALLGVTLAVAGAAAVSGRGGGRATQAAVADLPVPVPVPVPGPDLDQPNCINLGLVVGSELHGPLPAPYTLEDACVDMAINYAHPGQPLRLRLADDLMGRRRMPVIGANKYLSARQALDQLAATLAISWQVAPDGTILLSDAGVQTQRLDDPLAADPTDGITAFLIPYDQHDSGHNAVRRALTRDEFRPRIASCIALPEALDAALVPTRVQLLDRFCDCTGGRWHQTATGIELELPADPALRLWDSSPQVHLLAHDVTDLIGDQTPVEERLLITDLDRCRRPARGAPANWPVPALFVTSSAAARVAELRRMTTARPYGMNALALQQLIECHERTPTTTRSVEAYLNDNGHASIARLLHQARRDHVSPGGIAAWRIRDQHWRTNATRALQHEAVPLTSRSEVLGQRVRQLVRPTGLVVALGPSLAVTLARAPAANARTVAQELDALPGVDWELADGVLYAELGGPPTADLVAALALEQDALDNVEACPVDRFITEFLPPSIPCRLAGQSSPPTVTLTLTHLSFEQAITWVARLSGMRMQLRGPEVVLMDDGDRVEFVPGQRHVQHRQMDDLAREADAIGLDLPAYLREVCSIDGDETWTWTGDADAKALDLAADGHVQRLVSDCVESMRRSRQRAGGLAEWYRQDQAWRRRCATSLTWNMPLDFVGPMPIDSFAFFLHGMCDVSVIVDPALRGQTVTVSDDPVAAQVLTSLTGVAWRLVDGAVYLLPRATGAAGAARPDQPKAADPASPTDASKPASNF